MQKAARKTPQVEQLLADASELKTGTRSGGFWWFFIYAILAIVSPWFWAVGLLGGPVAALLLPRHVDEDGKEHIRWREGFITAAVIGYIISYFMVAAGFHLLPYLAKLVLPVA